MTTCETPKLRLRRAIRFTDMTTLRTFTARIPRVHDSSGYPCKTSLVLDKVSELVERPRMQNCSLLTPSRDPGTDTAQILQRDPATSAFSLGNDLLGNYVIGVSGEPCFLAGELLEVTPCGAASTLLELATEPRSTAANVSDAGTRERLAIRGSSDDLDAQVDPEKRIDFLQWRVVNIANRNQVELPIVVEQVSLSQLRSQQFNMVRAALVSQLAPTVNRPDTNVLILEVAQDVAVVGESSPSPEVRLLVLVYGIGVGDFTNRPNDYFGSKSEPFSGFVVTEIVESVLAEHFRLPSLLADPVATIVGTLQGFEQARLLPFVCN